MAGKNCSVTKPSAKELKLRREVAVQCSTVMVLYSEVAPEIDVDGRQELVGDETLREKTQAPYRLLLLPRPVSSPGLVLPPKPACRRGPSAALRTLFLGSG